MSIFVRVLKISFTSSLIVSLISLNSCGYTDSSVGKEDSSHASVIRAKAGHFMGLKKKGKSKHDREHKRHKGDKEDHDDNDDNDEGCEASDQSVSLSLSATDNDQLLLLCHSLQDNTITSSGMCQLSLLRTKWYAEQPAGTTVLSDMGQFCQLIFDLTPPPPPPPPLAAPRRL